MNLDPDMMSSPSRRQQEPIREPDSWPASPKPSQAMESGWSLIEEGFTLAREQELESIFTVANGYVGTRGSLPERTALSAPATFLAGVFEAGPSPQAPLELVTLPDWTGLRILVEGIPLSLETGEFLSHRRVIDVRRGIFSRAWRQQDRAGRVTKVQVTRLVSLHDRHLFAQAMTITPENYSGTIALESSIEKPNASPGWRLRIEGAMFHMDKTTERGIAIAMAMASRMAPAEGSKPDGTLALEPSGPMERWRWQARLGQTAHHVRTVRLYTSRETNDPRRAARENILPASNESFGLHLNRHTAAWDERWRVAGLHVAGDDAAQLALRFALYHLYGSANPSDEHVSIGARALSGKNYKGHVFWDTEIYLLPVYTFTYPAAAKALLMYRFHALTAAKERARRLGYGGALYAWESADTGEDVTPESVIVGGEVVKVLTGLQEHHISADIAYAVWQYWQATHDVEFLTQAGAEILIETARFWATRGRLESDGRYHIRTVIGPDEHHEAVDDNAYTNVMASCNLEWADDAAEWLRRHRLEDWKDLARRLHVREDERASWRRTAQAMATGFDAGTNLFEQFTGYFKLEPLDLNAYRARTVPIDVILGHGRVQQTNVVKQADVVALSALLWDRFPAAVHAANFRYYEPRTAHDSSLSPAFHALVGARLGDMDLALRYFREAAAIDLSNNMGNAAGGVHIAALGGLWQAAVLGMGGVRLKDDRLVIEPHLPKTWRELAFTIQWRGRTVAIAISAQPAQIVATLEAGDPMSIELGQGNITVLEGPQPRIARLTKPGWRLSDQQDGSV